MGFLEKVKNMFTEEVEEDEVKVEKVDRVKKEIISSFNDETEDKKFTFEETVEDTKPIFFDDNAFKDLDTETKVVEEKKEEEVKEKTKTREDKYAKKGNYKESMKESFKEINNEPEEEKEEKKKFKPTPIISPVYGVLDKNYHKEDIVSKDNSNKNNNEEPLIDQVRNKAYGTLEDELENTLFGKNSILFNDDKDDEDSDELVKTGNFDLDGLTDDISKELDEMLIKKKKDIKKQDKNDDVDDDLLDFIDSTLYKKEGDEE